MSDISYIIPESAPYGKNEPRESHKKRPQDADVLHKTTIQ